MRIDQSCQMTMALRPRPTASTINSRQGSQALARGARLGWSPVAATAGPIPAQVDGAAEESVDTSGEMAGFQLSTRRKFQRSIFPNP